MFRQQRDPFARGRDAAANEQLRAIPGHSANWQDDTHETARRARGVPTFNRPVYAMVLTHWEPRLAELRANFDDLATCRAARRAD